MSEIKFITKVQQITESLRDRIKNEFAPGMQIPSETGLAKEYKVCRVTIGKAIAELVAEGLLERIQGKGTFVSKEGPLSLQRDKTWQQVLRIGFWKEDPLLDIFYELEAGFRKETGFGIEPVILPGFPFLSNARESIEKGLLDAFFINSWQIREIVKQGDALDLSPFLNNNLLAGCYQKIVNIFKYKDKQYAIPIRWSPVVLYFNKDLFDKKQLKYPAATWTWDDFLHTAQALTERGPNNVSSYGFLCSFHENRWPIWVMQNGGSVISDDGNKCLLSLKESIEGIEFYKNLIYKYHISPISPELDSNYSDLFRDGHVGMIANGYTSLHNYREIKKFDWDITHLPIGKKKFTNLMTLAYVISRTTKFPEIALRFGEYLLRDDVQMLIGKKGGEIPIVKSVAESKDFAEKILPQMNYNVFFEALEYARPISTFFNDEIHRFMQERMRMVWLDMSETGKICKEIEEELNSIIKV